MTVPGGTGAGALGGGGMPGSALEIILEKMKTNKFYLLYFSNTSIPSILMALVLKPQKELCQEAIRVS